MVLRVPLLFMVGLVGQDAEQPEEEQEEEEGLTIEYIESLKVSDRPWGGNGPHLNNRLTSTCYVAHADRSRN